VGALLKREIQKRGRKELSKNPKPSKNSWSHHHSPLIYKIAIVECGITNLPLSAQNASPNTKATWKLHGQTWK